jgi:adenylate cyclase
VSDLVKHLAEYPDAMSEVMQVHHGVVAKVVGDGITALSNASHARQASRGGLSSTGPTSPGRRICVHTGDAIVGNVWTPVRFDYAVIGDAVNLASDIESLNKLHDTSILARQDLRDAVGRRLRMADAR